MGVDAKITKADADGQKGAVGQLRVPVSQYLGDH